MQRVLQVVNIMDRGGVETLLMNIYRKINRESIQFDFLTHPYDQDYLYEYESEILSMGGQIYKAPSFSQNLHDYQTYIKVFFRNHPEYTVVHAHNLDSASLVYMREAKKSDHGGILKRRMLQICHHIVRRYPDHFYACSRQAAEFAFGKRIASSCNCEIFYNGIDLARYHVNEIEHNIARKKLSLDVDGPVFGTVGRLLSQKNHTFLLDVFAAILRREPSSTLIIVGKGDLQTALERKAKDLGISRHVHFVGSVPNVPDYLKAFDVFLFPSLYAGLGMAAVEAQACGLPTLMSDEVPSLAACTDLAEFISLSADAEKWADESLRAYRESIGHRSDRIEQVRDAGFDITEIAEKLCSFYISHNSN